MPAGSQVSLDLLQTCDVNKYVLNGVTVKLFVGIKPHLENDKTLTHKKLSPM